MGRDWYSSVTCGLRNSACPQGLGYVFRRSRLRVACRRLGRVLISQTAMVDTLCLSRQSGQEISAPVLASLLKVALSTPTPVDTSYPVVGHTNVNVPILTSLNEAQVQICITSRWRGADIVPTVQCAPFMSTRPPLVRLRVHRYTGGRHGH